jgi:hypothetical protein
MKTVMLGVLLISSLSAFASKVENTKGATIRVARVQKVIPLVEKSDIEVKVVVQELGLSTDVSPTKQIFLTIYAPGEMNDAESTFEISQSYGVDSAKRIAPGIYQVKASLPSPEDRMPVNALLTIDATKATVGIKKMPCPEFETCEFNGSVDVSVKYIK